MTFSALQQRHESLLARQDGLTAEDVRRREPAAAQLARDAQQFIADAVTESSQVADPRERDLLRAYLRYWATFIYDLSGVFPKTDLRPAEIAAPRPDTTARPDVAVEAPPARGGRPGWLWPLVGLLGLLLLLAAAGSLLLNRGGGAGEEVIDPDISLPGTARPPIVRTPLPRTPVPATPIDQSNAASVQALTRADAHTGNALAVDFDPQRPEVATGGADGRVRFWTVPDLTLSRQLDDQRGWVRTVDYSPYGNRVGAPPLFLTGGNDRVLRVYDLESLQLFADYTPTDANSGFVFAARFNPGGNLFASGHGDGLARIWEVATGTENSAVPSGPDNTRLAQIPSGGTAVQDVAYRADGAALALALGGAPTGIQVMDGTYTTMTCGVNSGPTLAVAYSPRGDLLAAGTERGALLLLSPDVCQSAFEVAAHEGGVADVAFSPTGEWLVTGGRDGTMKIWSPDGRALATLTAGVPVEAVAVSADAGYIASVDADGRLILWGIQR
jgi:hypothetical protein